MAQVKDMEIAANEPLLHQFVQQAKDMIDDLEDAYQTLYKKVKILQLLYSLQISDWQHQQNPHRFSRWSVNHL